MPNGEIEPVRPYVAAVQLSDAAERDFAEVRTDEHLRFTIEEAVGIGERAVVDVEAVFKHEAHGHAVAEVFRALHAPAAAGREARLHRKVVVVINVRFVLIDVLILQAGVNAAVKRNFGSGRNTRKGAEDGENSQTLLEHFEFLPRVRSPAWGLGLSASQSSVALI